MFTQASFPHKTAWQTQQLLSSWPCFYNGAETDQNRAERWGNTELTFIEWPERETIHNVGLCPVYLKSTIFCQHFSHLEFLAFYDFQPLRSRGTNTCELIVTRTQHVAKILFVMAYWLKKNESLAKAQKLQKCTFFFIIIASCGYCYMVSKGSNYICGQKPNSKCCCMTARCESIVR